MPLKVTHQGGESVVQDDATALIGSDASATIRIVRPGISRRHAVVSRDGSGWKVQDAGSRNGTFLDGQRVQVVSIDGPTTLFLGHPSDGEALSLVPSTTGAPAAAGKPASAPAAGSTQPLPAAAPPKDASPTGRASAPAGSPAPPPPAAAAAAVATGAGASPKGRPPAKASDDARTPAKATAPARTAAPVQASDIEVAQLTAAIRDQISAIKGLTWSVWAMIAVTAALIVLTLFVGILSN